LPEIILTAALVCALAAFLTDRFTHPTSRFYVPDIPNARSLHATPTPRSGGVAIVAAILAGSIYLTARSGTPSFGLIWMATALVIIAALGFWDDRRPIQPLPRLIAQGVVAAMLVGSGFVVTSIDLPGVSLPLGTVAASVTTWLFILWMVNLFNFMDGMDGLAGSMTVIGFGTFAVFGYIANHELFFSLSLTIAAAALGFLILNLPPARIFMGDAGAYSLGLLAATFTIWGVSDGVFRLWNALLVFLPFTADATLTLIIRTCKRKRVWDAHREHVYQRAILAGHTPQTTLAIECGLMLLCGYVSVLTSG
jgi:UDP-N-acetylmuramyl pentapeptide phosphotransferase/UDP-N-acetylglucosamine-1-phosphate transferase